MEKADEILNQLEEHSPNWVAILRRDRHALKREIRRLKTMLKKKQK